MTSGLKIFRLESLQAQKAEDPKAFKSVFLEAQKALGPNTFRPERLQRQRDLALKKLSSESLEGLSSTGLKPCGDSLPTGPACFNQGPRERGRAGQWSHNDRAFREEPLVYLGAHFFRMRE